MTLAVQFGIRGNRLLLCSIENWSGRVFLRGRSGRIQGTDFRADPGQEKILGRIGIGVRPRTGFRIDLLHRGVHRFRVRSKIRIWIGVMYPSGRPELEMALYEV